jgi:MFS family permease
MADVCGIEYWHFILAFGILGGIGTSLIFTPAISAVGHFFAVRRGYATGLATTGGSVGGICFPLMLQRLFATVGYAWATRIMGFILLFLVIIANLLIKKRLPPKSGGSVWPDWRIFKDVVFALCTLGVFFIEWGLFIPISYLSLYALSAGINPTFAYQLLALLNVGSFFGRWLPGYVADEWGRYNTMVITVVMSLICVLGLWLPASTPDSPVRTNIPLIVIFAMGFGFSSGSNISLTPVCVGQLCDTEEYGRYYATCYTIVSFGCLTGIPIAGAILGIDGGEYWGLVLFTGLCYAAGLACFVAARVIKVGWDLRKIY